MATGLTNGDNGMNRETRRMRNGEIRAVEEDGQHFITLRPIAPGVVDDYGSVWMADTFDEAVSERMPTLTWGHSWSDPIGRGVEYTPGDDGPTIRFRLDNFDDVPRARQAFSQTTSGTIDDCSVGFSGTDRREATDDDISKWPGCREVIMRANLDEVGLVLRGAVPGAKVLSVRSAGGTGEVDAEFVLDLARRVNAGELSEADAKTAIDLAAATDPIPPEPTVDTTDADGALQDAEEALAALAAPRSR